MKPNNMKKKPALPKLGTVPDYRHFWMLSFWILYLVLFFVVEKLITTDYWVSYLPLDDKIPFCEYFIVPYCMWHPLLFLMTVYLAFYDVETFRKYMWFVLAGLVSAIVVCWIFPNGQDLRPTEFAQHDLFTWLVQRIYAADTNTNVLPSMHVIGCAALTLACFDSEPLRRRHLQWVMLPLGLVISMSTVFVKQHSILDVFVAIPVCVILYFIIYHRAFVKKFGKAANRDA